VRLTHFQPRRCFLRAAARDKIPPTALALSVIQYVQKRARKILSFDDRRRSRGVVSTHTFTKQSIFSISLFYAGDLGALTPDKPFVATA
jgi:hypothetical protein